MRTLWAVLFLGICSLLIPSSGTAGVYTDATGDIGAAITYPANLDIMELNLSNTATDLVFDLRVNANIAATNWGKYMIGIDVTNQSGGGTDNGWNRPISFDSPGINYWVGSWVDGPSGGVQLYHHSGNWSLTGTPSIDLSNASSGRAKISVPLADLGLNSGDTIKFDVFSSGGGGGDGAVDSLTKSTATINWWTDSYTASSLSSYTVAAVPEASSVLFTGLVGGISLLFYGWRRVLRS